MTSKSNNAAADVQEVVNPYDLSVIGSVDTVDWKTVDQYLDAGFNLFRNRNNWLPSYQRICLLYTSPSPRDLSTSRMPSSA